MSKVINDELHYTRKEAAAKLGYSVPKLDRLLAAKLIGKYQINPGTGLTISESQIREHIERCRQQQAAREDGQQEAA